MCVLAGVGGGRIQLDLTHLTAKFEGLRFVYADCSGEF